MNIDINVIVAKAQAKIGELEMQLIIAEATIEHLQAQAVKNEAPSQSETKEE